jgi:ABC-type lipoprotein export system ATPase subunit
MRHILKNMRKVVFTIRNLTCAYQPETPVLVLDELEIPAGRLVFVIGKSGVGKSTLLETLGLMNRTIVAHPDTSLVMHNIQGEALELKNCWDWTNERLSHFRREHLSFIFQQTNLMPNFSAGENMAISLLIEGYSFAEAKREVLAVMDKLSLPQVIFDKKVTELSGGQRQRLAFVRAITSHFTVLFGDEPTGNLDPLTAEKLLRVLKDLVDEKNRTIVLVSHDLNLAAKFADYIMPITPAYDLHGNVFGNIVKNNIVVRSESGWIDGAGRELSSPDSFLNDCLSA